MAASILPRNFSLSVTQDITTTTTKRINRFLEMEHEAVASHGLFIAKGEQIPNPFSLLEPVNAGSGRVHLRCRFNNKYLSIRSETDHRITAEADEPVEDQSSWNCTMFTVTTNQSTGRTRVDHVHLGRRVVAMEPDRILTIGQDDQTAVFDDFAVHDVSAILALNLPQFFKFKHNDIYAQAFPHDEYLPGIAFFRDVDESNPDLVFEILPVDVGLIRIRSIAKENACWRAYPYGTDILIRADTSVHLASLPPDHSWWDGFFNIQRIINANGDVDNVIAISYSDSGSPMWLVAIAGAILGAMPRDVNTPPPADARFVMEEAIRARSIFNVRYNVLAARLLPGHPQSMSTQTMSNGSSLPQMFERTFSFTETTTTRWNATVAASISVEISVSMGVPFFASGSITTTYEISGAYEWGADHTTEVTKVDSITITVPPMTTLSVSRWESHGSYDIPFSYTQEDTLYGSGKRVVTEKHDGLAIGINNHDIFYNVVETPMAPSKDQEAREYRIVPTSSRIVATPNNPSPASLTDWILQQPEDTYPVLSGLRKYISNRLTSK